jgi:hypothetical protein
MQHRTRQIKNRLQPGLCIDIEPGERRLRKIVVTARAISIVAALPRFADRHAYRCDNRRTAKALNGEPCRRRFHNFIY